ncbi:hypothetical protein ACFLZE_04875 [Thermodesulfobacteriota bacterium]
MIPNLAPALAANILFHSDSEPGTFSASALTEDFNAAQDLLPAGWSYDCVQNVGDISPVSALDDAFDASGLIGLPHFLCVGNHDAEEKR